LQEFAPAVGLSPLSFGNQSPAVAGKVYGIFGNPDANRLVVSRLAVQCQFSSKSAPVHCVFLHAGRKSAAPRTSGIKIQVLETRRLCTLIPDCDCDDDCEGRIAASQNNTEPAQLPATTMLGSESLLSPVER
jgi:hypothetical protein